MKTIFKFVVVLAIVVLISSNAGAGATPDENCGESVIRSNFNGTPIAGDNYIWFNSVLKVSGVRSPTTIQFDSWVGFNTAIGPHSAWVPSGEITFDPGVTSATTTFECDGPDLYFCIWKTTVPLNYTGNVFLTGLAFPLPSEGLPGGINPVDWHGMFYSNTPEVKIQWKWAAAVYSSMPSDYSLMGVKQVDDGKLSDYRNSDHAGTPESFKKYLVGGARGGGGSNYTGSYSGTASFVLDSSCWF